MEMGDCLFKGKMQNVLQEKWSKPHVPKNNHSEMLVNSLSACETYFLLRKQLNNKLSQFSINSDK